MSCYRNIISFSLSFLKNESDPFSLKYAELFTITNEECKKRSHTPNLTNTTLCAVSRKATSGAYFGDSGGPVFIHRTIVGVVSWGTKDPTAANRVDGYTRVSEFATWIDQTMENLV